MANASQNTSDTSTSTKEDRWYLGEGVSQIVNGDASYLIIKVADFPEAKWNEWNQDCKKNFNNCRWAKMMQDHVKSAAFDLMVKDKFKTEQKDLPKEVTIGGEGIE